MVGAGSDGQVAALLAACAAALDDPLAAPFAAALADLDPGAATETGSTGSLPVLRWWEQCLAQPGPAVSRGIARALRALRPSLSFVQNPNYVAAPPTAGFLERYGYAVLAGPSTGPPALIEHAGLAFGVLLLGPHTTYPTHVHPAAELYLPLGAATWSLGGAAPQLRPAGTSIVHRANEPHETRTGATPLAALYIWLGELGTAARVLDLGLTRP